MYHRKWCWESRHRCRIKQSPQWFQCPFQGGLLWAGSAGSHCSNCWSCLDSRVGFPWDLSKQLANSCCAEWEGGHTAGGWTQPRAQGAPSPWQCHAFSLGGFHSILKLFLYFQRVHICCFLAAKGRKKKKNSKIVCGKQTHFAKIFLKLLPSKYFQEHPKLNWEKIELPEKQRREFPSPQIHILHGFLVPEYTSFMISINRNQNSLLQLSSSVALLIPMHCVQTPLSSVLLLPTSCFGSPVVSLL